MNGSETLFSCDIVQQSRFQYVVIALVMVATITAGATIGAIVVKLGAPPKAQGGVSALSFLLSIGLAVWYLSGAQGKVTLSDAELVVKPTWRPATRIQRPPVAARLQQWNGVTRGVAFTIGPMLLVEGRGESVSLAAMDPPAGERLPSKQGVQRIPHPSFVIAPGDFERLVEKLGLAWPASP